LRRNVASTRFTVAASEAERETPAVDQRLTFMTLGVADVDRARTFYESLGWSGESPDGDIYLFQMNGMVLGLWNRQKLADDCCVQDSGGWGGVQLTHNVGSREEVDAIMGEAEAAGATIGRPAEVQPWGGYTGVFHDLDGHAWEIAHIPWWILTEDGGIRLH
jgi:predicted lactoylglutathione lyase